MDPLAPLCFDWRRLSSVAGSRGWRGAGMAWAFAWREKEPRAVILSETKNLSSIQVRAKYHREILRFAQNDSVFLVFLAAFETSAASPPTNWNFGIRRL